MSSANHTHVTDELGASLLRQKAQKAAGPCEGCRHADRCREGLACRASELWVQTGRYSAVAPRQPSAEIYERIHMARPRPTDVERQRAREALAVKMQREADY
jgi:hypothetical protein